MVEVVDVLPQDRSRRDGTVDVPRPGAGDEPIQSQVPVNSCFTKRGSNNFPEIGL